MLDLEGTTLTDEDREILRHPTVGGVILFARNYESPAQIEALVTAIHAVREPRLLVAVDQEGGRVQRFRSGFTVLPPAAGFGALHQRGPERARRAARAVGWLMAAELRAVGVDFSFAPVLDLDRGVCPAIGNRAFGAGVNAVSSLAGAWAEGVREAGMPAVGKHFPGHGAVPADSHFELPSDPRDYATIELEDLVPFGRLIRRGLEAVMPAHVVYPRVDPAPAGFSPFWLRTVLRGRLGFEGVIFSDDLNMAAASAGGDYAGRARAARAAGCDLLLVCNNRPAAVAAIDGLEVAEDPAFQLRCIRMHGRGGVPLDRLHLDPRWQEGVREVAALQAGESLELGL